MTEETTTETPVEAPDVKPSTPTFGEVRDLALTRLVELLENRNNVSTEGKVKAAQTLFTIATEANWQERNRDLDASTPDAIITDGEPAEAEVVNESDEDPVFEPPKKKKKDKKKKDKAATA